LPCPIKGETKKSEKVMTKKEQKKQAAAAIASDIIDTSKDLLSAEKAAEVNTYKFGPHYVDTANDIAGIGELLESILKAFGCVHPMGIEDTEKREKAIGKSMFMAELDREVRRAFAEAGKRYPQNSLRVYLSNHKAGFVFGSIQLTGIEDTGRTSPKPRAKYYLPKTVKASKAAE
jgi:predicted flap endonuclease-1-like 5' DNA nuclease